MTDAEWAAVRPLLPVPTWLQGRGGPPEGYCRRQRLDAIRNLVAGRISWRALPEDFPARGRVYAFFRRWREHKRAAAKAAKTSRRHSPTTGATPHATTPSMPRSEATAAPPSAGGCKASGLPGPPMPG
ncbi:transposase [Streptomyces sp. CA-179760]|uniref:transposase n=1 Tax=Streptomyces sp. CA-179760 TaxID=3240054 RepID=UPI003D949901